MPPSSFLNDSGSLTQTTPTLSPAAITRFARTPQPAIFDGPICQASDFL